MAYHTQILLLHENLSDCEHFSYLFTMVCILEKCLERQCSILDLLFEDSRHLLCAFLHAFDLKPLPVLLHTICIQHKDPIIAKCRALVGTQAIAYEENKARLLMKFPPDGRLINTTIQCSGSGRVMELKEEHETEHVE